MNDPIAPRPARIVPELASETLAAWNFPSDFMVVLGYPREIARCIRLMNSCPSTSIQNISGLTQGPVHPFGGRLNCAGAAPRSTRHERAGCRGETRLGFRHQTQLVPILRGGLLRPLAIPNPLMTQSPCRPGRRSPHLPSPTARAQRAEMEATRSGRSPSLRSSSLSSGPGTRRPWSRSPAQARQAA